MLVVLFCRPYTNKKGIIVSANIAFGSMILGGVGSSTTTPNRPGNWSILDKYFVESLIYVLNLTSSDAALVKVALPGIQ